MSPNPPSVRDYIDQQLRAGLRRNLDCPHCGGGLIGLHPAFDAWCDLCGYGRTAVLADTPHVAILPPPPRLLVGILTAAAGPVRPSQEARAHDR